MQVRARVTRAVEFVLAGCPATCARARGRAAATASWRVLDAAGYDILAIDLAPEGEIFERTTIEALEDPGLFEAVVASRSLHHVDDLDAALTKIAGLRGCSCSTSSRGPARRADRPVV